MAALDRRLRLALCVAAMAAIAVVTFAWWGVSWLTMALFAIALACLGAVVYAWRAAGKMDKSRLRRHS
ncbi:MAG: hypothetical protein AB1560_03145, partial [Pseudomonadota bacterium]